MGDRVSICTAWLWGQAECSCDKCVNGESPYSGQNVDAYGNEGWSFGSGDPG